MCAIRGAIAARSTRIPLLRLARNMTGEKPQPQSAPDINLYLLSIAKGNTEQIALLGPQGVIAWCRLPARVH
jgi:hypothetical protein